MVRVLGLIAVLILFLGVRAPELTRSDNGLRLDVLATLTDDPRLRDNKPLVSVSQKSVRLRGEFNDLSAKVTAEQLSAAVPGVASVRSEIRVQPVVERNDDEIRLNVLELVEADPILSARSLVINVKDSKISLGGSVVNAAEKNRAARVAARASGAADLSSTINVIGNRALPTDAVIKRTVESRIYRDPILSPGDGNRVRVSVKDSVVRLRGVVDSLTEYTAATRDAFSGGAARVLNELQTRSGEVTPGSKQMFATYPGEAYPVGWKEPGNVQRAPAAAPSPEPRSNTATRNEPRPRETPAPTPTAMPTPSPSPTPSPTPSPSL